MGQMGLIELEMERIGPAVVELQYTQDIGCPSEGESPERASDLAIAHPHDKFIP